MKRKYTKHDVAYWNRHSSSLPAGVTIQTGPAAPAQPAITPTPFPTIFYGETQIRTAANREAIASSYTDNQPTSYRSSQYNNGLVDPYAFQNIKALPSTYVGFTGQRQYIGMQEPILLCMKAWAGLAIIRNSIEIAVEFSTQPLHFRSENSTVETFFNEWWQAIQGPKLVEQSMREYYRSGNVFYLTFYGRFGPDYYKHFQQAYGAKENKVPIRYEILNPANIFVPTGLAFPYTYVRLLSTYEVERLKNPITEQDKQVYKDMPEIVKKQIETGITFPMGIYMPMQPERLRFFFYKKQDYEPLAIPMVWPVLPDVEWKLTLKKMDMELTRKIEHAILLVTTGEAPNQWNGGNGINHNNLARLQNIFSNQAIMRTLVADYTTKGQWLIPDVKEILGPEKYKIVDQDIKEGLQSILTGEDKFANAQIKAKIFIQRLEEGQQKFLNDFLMPEIISIAKKMGFRNIPQVSFQKIDLSDETITNRIYAQLAQIGVLTAPQTVKAIETGILPNESEILSGQKEYKKQRKEGLFEPLIGGQKDGQNPNGRPSGTSGTPQSSKRISPIGTNASEQIASTDAFSLKKYIENLKKSQSLAGSVASALCKKFKVKELNEAQQNVVQLFAKTIMATQLPTKWESSIASVIKSPPKISKIIADEIAEIQAKYDVDDWDATVLRLCRVDAPKEKGE